MKENTVAQPAKQFKVKSLPSLCCSAGSAWELRSKPSHCRTSIGWDDEANYISELHPIKNR